jgi:hypothetical protein
MGFIAKLRKLPDDKKKTVAAVTALFLTIIISVSWFAFGPKKNNNDAGVNPILQDAQMNSLAQSIQQSISDFNRVESQLFGTTTSTSTIASSTNIISTTTSTTTNN